MQQRSLVATSPWRWRNSVRFELAKAFFTDPVRGPGRIEHRVYGDVAVSNELLKRFAHIALDAFGGGATGISGTEVDVANGAL
jgi:hypothetical protein